MYFSHSAWQYAVCSGEMFVGSSDLLERVARQRRRLQRERLRRRRLLAGHRALRHRTLLHAEHRLAGDAIEDEQQAHLGDLRDGRNRSCRRCIDVDQRRRRAEVVVPDVVMHELLMPLAACRSRCRPRRATCHTGCRRAVDADVVAAGDRHRDVDDAALLVDRQVAPRVGAADRLPRVVLPRLVIGIARLRDRDADVVVLTGDRGRHVDDAALVSTVR